MKPDRGAVRIPQVAPLRAQLLHQVQAMAVGREQFTLDDGHVGRAAVDHLDQYAVRHVDDGDRDRPVVRA